MKSKKKIVKRIRLILAAGILTFGAISLPISLHAAAKTGSGAAGNTADAAAATARAFSGNMLVEWSKSDDADGFLIYRISRSGSQILIGNIDNKNRLFYNDRKGTAGKYYKYRIKAYKNQGSVKKILKISNTTSYKLYLPAFVVPKTVSYKNHKDTITWTRVSGADGYYIYAKKTGSRGWKRITKLSRSRTSYSVSNKTGAKMTYAIKSYVRSGGKEYTGEGYYGIPNIKVANKEKILFIGDSITWGSMGGHTQAAPYYAEYAARYVGAGFTNIAHSSYSLAYHKGSPRSVMAMMNKGEVKAKGYSTIYIAIGTNDYGSNVLLGSLNSSDKTTFYGAMNRLLATIRKDNPKAKIILSTLVYRTKHGPRVMYSLQNVKNGVGLTMEDYNEAIRNLAEKYNTYLYDIAKSDAINESNRYNLLADGIHPTQEGHLVLGAELARYLEEEVY